MDDALAFERGIGTLLLGGRELHAHLRQPGDHVLALLLEKAHVGLHAAEHVLHAAALLAEVAHEQALLLEQGLELVELTALLVDAVLGELDGRLGLAVADGEGGVALLEAAQVVDGEDGRELGELLGEVARAHGLVDLALERLELPHDLPLDDLGLRQVLVHRCELALGADLAAAMLGDIRRLLDEGAAFLGPAREDRIELTLADDRMGILAEARVVQDVGDVHQAARRVVDEVLALARTVHAARDRDLGEVDGQRVVGVVEDEGDLCEADGAAGR